MGDTVKFSFFQTGQFGGEEGCGRRSEAVLQPEDAAEVGKILERMAALEAETPKESPLLDGEKGESELSVSSTKVRDRRPVYEILLEKQDGCRFVAPFRSHVTDLDRYRFSDKDQRKIRALFQKYFASLLNVTLPGGTVISLVDKNDVGDGLIAEPNAAAHPLTEEQSEQVLRVYNAGWPDSGCDVDMECDFEEEPYWPGSTFYLFLFSRGESEELAFRLAYMPACRQSYTCYDGTDAQFNSGQFVVDGGFDFVTLTPEGSDIVENIVREILGKTEV